MGDLIAAYKVADMYKNGYYVQQDTEKYKSMIEELEGPAAEKNMDQRKRSGSVSIKKSKGMPEEKRTVKNDNKFGAVGSQPGAVNKYGAVGSQPGMDNRYGAVGSQPTRKRK